MKHNKRERVSRRCIIALVVSSMMLLTACAGEPAGDVSPTIVEGEESQQLVQVKKSDYEFTYSGTMADVITIKELEDSNNLEFTAKVGQQEFTIFIMHFNAEEGDLVEFITDSKGNRIPVAFEMMPLPDGLQEDEAMQFYLAQGSVNDVVASITVK